MSKELDYTVLREHDGDRFYKAGEIRSLAPADAKHLVKLGTLAAQAEAEEPAEGEGGPDDARSQGEGLKSDAAPLNKLEPAPANKAEEPAVTAAATPASTHAPRSRRQKA